MRTNAHMNEDTGVDTAEGHDPDAGADAADQERTVPLSAFMGLRTELQDLKTQLAEARGKVDGLTAGQTQQAEPEYTRAELRRAVDEGRLSEDEADDIYDRQTRTRMSREIEQEISTRFAQTTTVKQAHDEVNKYLAAIPEVENPESAEFKKVKAEYDHLVSLGYDPHQPQTQAAALRAAFGDPAKRVKGKRPLETFQDTGGSGGGETESKGVEGLNNDQKAFYRKQIDAGRYSGWDDPNLKSEIEYAKARKAA